MFHVRIRIASAIHCVGFLASDPLLARRMNRIRLADTNPRCRRMGLDQNNGHVPE